MAKKRNPGKQDFLETLSPSLASWKKPDEELVAGMSKNQVLNCGWGKLIFANTFSDSSRVAQEILEEAAEQRNIACYVPDPHVVLSIAPQELFLDPSHSYRLWLKEFKAGEPPQFAFEVRQADCRADYAQINRILKQQQMVPFDEDFVWSKRDQLDFIWMVAEAEGRLIGAVMAVDHRIAFGDVDNGASFWALAVDTEAVQSGIGQALVRKLIRHFNARGRDYLDCSVMHDNQPAINLYEKLGFIRIPAFSIKRKNAINEKLFTTHLEEGLNPYAGILVKEARRRGIQAEIMDAANGLFILSHGGVRVHCRESLTELTSAFSMSLCEDKRITLDVLKKTGLRVPNQQVASSEVENNLFLERFGAVVVKPARGEQGQGVAVDLRTTEELAVAIEKAKQYCETVILEEMVPGSDLRIVVINYQVVAAAIRYPATITGDGQSNIRRLIQRQSRRRQSQTGGESKIPFDEETYRTVKLSGYKIDEVLPAGESLQVRKTANLHTGGILQDVTSDLHPKLVEVAVEAAKALLIPVVGLDLLVPAVQGEEYVLIEANERPGLANHEPQPTAERFIDLLFPGTISPIGH